jgi:hypothetical protein
MGMLFSDDEVNNPDNYVYAAPDGMEINTYLPALEEIVQKLIQLVDAEDEDKRVTPLLSIVNLSLGDELGTDKDRLLEVILFLISICIGMAASLNDMQPAFGKELVSACAESRLDTLREPRPFWDDPSSIDGSC